MEEWMDIRSAARIIKSVYYVDRNKPGAEKRCYNDLKTWSVSNSILSRNINGVTHLPLYWVEEFAAEKRFRIVDFSRNLGIPLSTVERRLRYPEGNILRINREKLPGGRSYITGEEYDRYKDIAKEASGHDESGEEYISVPEAAKIIGTIYEKDRNRDDSVQRCAQQLREWVQEEVIPFKRVYNKAHPFNKKASRVFLKKSWVMEFAAERRYCVKDLEEALGRSHKYIWDRTKPDHPEFIKLKTLPGGRNYVPGEVWDRYFHPDEESSFSDREKIDDDLTRMYEMGKLTTIEYAKARKKKMNSERKLELIIADLEDEEPEESFEEFPYEEDDDLPIAAPRTA